MLKGQDLAKQFELVVKQEIINHNQQISQSNQSFQKLRIDVEQDSIKTKRILDDLDSRCSQLRSENKGIIEGHQKFSAEMQNLLQFVNESIVVLGTKFRAYCDAQEGEYLTLGDFSKFKENLDKDKKSFKVVTKDLKSEIDWASKYLQDQVKASLGKFREEIAIRPSNLIELEVRLQEKIESMRVDRDGIMKDVHVVQRKNFEQSKHIENIYMLMGLTPKGGKKLLS